MTRRGSTLALVFSCAAACGCSNPPPAIAPPPTHVAEVPGLGDFARQTFASPLSIPDAEQILRRTEIVEYVRIPVHREHSFRFNVNTGSADAEQRFRPS